MLIYPPPPRNKLNSLIQKFIYIQKNLTPISLILISISSRVFNIINHRSVLVILISHLLLFQFYLDIHKKILNMIFGKSFILLLISLSLKLHLTMTNSVRSTHNRLIKWIFRQFFMAHLLYILRKIKFSLLFSILKFNYVFKLLCWEFDIFQAFEIIFKIYLYHFRVCFLLLLMILSN